MREVVIVEAVRTPIGKRNGALSGVPSYQLLSHVLAEVVRRSGVDPALVEDIVVGCTTQTGDQGNNVARLATLLAGFPDSVPATTLNRKCGSGQQAIHFISQAILAGDMEMGIAAGVESMSRSPIGDDRGPNSDELLAQLNIPHQGLSGELVAEAWRLTRDEMDEYAVRSHQLAAAAAARGDFDAEIAPVTLPDGTVVRQDEGIRPQSSVEKLAQLKPAFKEGGTITAANSSQISDAAAAVLIMSLDKARDLGLRPLAKVTGRALVGSDRTMMLTGPIPATQAALKRAGLTLDQIDLFEMNEAFAAPVLAWQRELGVPMDRVNVRGGAIALGHPTGCTGVRMAVTLVHALQQTGKRYGLQTMCVAAGMGTATVFEGC